MVQRSGRAIFLIRHGESAFNAALESLRGAAPDPAYQGGPELMERFEALRVDPSLRDAPLSPLGHRQVAAAADDARALGVDVVIVSPLTRALQTATGLFGGSGHGPRMEVTGTHTERLFSICDVGRHPDQLAARFPSLAFDHLDDVWWYPPALVPAEAGAPTSLALEPEDVFAARVQRFRDELSARPEPRIAVVGHGLFFGAVCGRHLANCEIHLHEPAP